VTASDVKFAQLDATQIESLKALESELGKVVVAVEPVARPAKLSQDQLQRLQAAETELGVILLALEGKP
jgi:hypothetical protein